jgi:hypothetical protein
MVRPAAAIFAVSMSLAASLLGPAARVEAAYRTEHTNWGNDGVRNDRIYARDPVSGKHWVLSRQWGPRCRSRAALKYGFEGGCWYPVKESYRAWSKRPEEWLRLGR